MTPVPPSLDYIKVQEDEIEVLKSIFMDDYEMVEAAGAWNVSNILIYVLFSFGSPKWGLFAFIHNF